MSEFKITNVALEKYIYMKPCINNLWKGQQTKKKMKANETFFFSYLTVIITEQLQLY